MHEQRLRTLKIKTGVVKRLAREKVYYQDESCEIEKKISGMQADGTDPYVIKKQHEVLQESQMMIPDCHKKLTCAFEELQKLLAAEKELCETEEYQIAEAVLTGAKAQLV